MKLVMAMAAGVLLIGCTLIYVEGSEDTAIDVLTDNDSGMIRTRTPVPDTPE